MRVLTLLACTWGIKLLSLSSLPFTLEWGCSELVQVCVETWGFLLCVVSALCHSGWVLTLQFSMAKSLQLVLIYLDQATNSHTSEEYKKLSNRRQRKSSLFSAQVHIFKDFFWQRPGRGCTDCCTDLRHSAYRSVEAVCRQPGIMTTRVLCPAPAPFSTTSRWPQQPPGTHKGAQVVARQSELPGWNRLQKFKAWSSPALPRVNTSRAFICRAWVVRQSGANTWLNNTQHREAHYVEGNGGIPVVVSAVWLHFKEPVEEEGLEKVFSYLKNDQTLITSSQLEQ